MGFQDLGSFLDLSVLAADRFIKQQKLGGKRLDALADLVQILLKREDAPVVLAPLFLKIGDAIARRFQPPVEVGDLELGLADQLGQARIFLAAHFDRFGIGSVWLDLFAQFIELAHKRFDLDLAHPHHFALAF
ncbi:MAG: hypothetical protein IPO29_19125 [Anaerolineae bacterium]|nr:hypothetical protein [Anaerolineae bacterium]